MEFALLHDALSSTLAPVRRALSSFVLAHQALVLAALAIVLLVLHLLARDAERAIERASRKRH